MCHCSKCSPCCLTWQGGMFPTMLSACVLLELDVAPTGTATTTFGLHLILALNNPSEIAEVLSASGSLLGFHRFCLSRNTKFYFNAPIRPHLLNTNIGVQAPGRRWVKMVLGRTGRPFWVVTCVLMGSHCLWTPTLTLTIFLFQKKEFFILLYTATRSSSDFLSSTAQADLFDSNA